jgi:C1A family cysteine protease
LPDYRDYLYSFAPVELPIRVDLTATGFCPPVYDQGNLGSCVANAIAADIDFIRKKQIEKFIYPSRLFIYRNIREMIDTVEYDSGGYIRDGIKSVVKQGACPEEQWPYDIDKFTQKPPQEAYDSALNYQTLVYQRIDNRNLDMLKNVIASGYPFVFGFSVYESFESEKVKDTGVVPMPSDDERLLGGHAVLGIGYSDKVRRFIVRNSWGSEWGGHGGYFSLPYSYITNEDLAADFWCIKVVE